MPYRNYTNLNGHSLLEENPTVKSLMNSSNGVFANQLSSQPLSRYVATGAPGISRAKASTFGEGMKVWGQQMANDMSYLGTMIDKEASGENYFDDAITSLQEYYNGNLLSQPNSELYARMKEIEAENQPIQFPAMGPTHAMSLSQPLNPLLATEHDLLGELAARRDAGYNDEENQLWLSNLQQYGGEASQRQREILEAAQAIPQTEGWGTVGAITGGVLEGLASVIGGAINPGLGMALGGLTLGKALGQSVAQTNKEIDMYEAGTNLAVSPQIRNLYVKGVAATDLLLNGLMQSRYFKQLELPAIKEIRKKVLKNILSSPKAANEINSLLRQTIKNTGRLSAEQAGASAVSALTRNMLGLTYKNPEHYPHISQIVKDATTQAVVGGVTGAVTGGIASGIGAGMRYHQTNPKIKLGVNFPAEYRPNGFSGLTGRLDKPAFRTREDKILQLARENFKRLPGDKVKVKNKPLIDLGEMTVEEYDRYAPQLREALEEFYLPERPTIDYISKKMFGFTPDRESNKHLFPFDLEGLSPEDWYIREKLVSDILGENYRPNQILYPRSKKESGVWNIGKYSTEYANSLRRDMLNEVGGKMKLKTRLYADINEVPQEYKKYLDDHSRSKGFYNPETDEVVIIGNNIRNQQELYNTLIQKGYETKGLKGVLGDELDNLLDDVYRNMTHRESERYSGSGRSSKEVALSYLSELAKNPSINPTEWQEISTYVRNLFESKYGIQHLTDDTVNSLLMRTANQITGDDTISDMIRKAK